MERCAVAFLPPLADEPLCHDCGKRVEIRVEVEDVERGLLLVCSTCQALRARFGRDPLA